MNGLTDNGFKGVRFFSSNIMLKQGKHNILHILVRFENIKLKVWLSITLFGVCGPIRTVGNFV